MNIQCRVILGVASLAALYSGAGQALGLGELQLQSALNQPLAATIELGDAAGLGPSDIRAGLARANAFDRAGIGRPVFLADLRFAPAVDNGRLVIRVESSRPVREPYLNFLVQLDSPAGSLLREYTVLLDPPQYAPAPVVAASAAATRGTTQPAASPASRSVPAPSRPMSTVAKAPEAGLERYQTRPGDSLWSIARTTRSNESVSVQQQMDAILALNPQAFVNGDPSRLRSGQVLVLPTGSREEGGAVVVASRPEPHLRTSAETAESEGAADRLSIEEPAPADAELEERLHSLETRFRGLMGELEKRDAQIASLQAQLEQRRRSRESGANTSAVATQAVTETPPGALDAETGGAQPVSTSEPGSTPGATESIVAQPEPLEPGAPQQSGWLARWWPLPISLLAVLAGVWMLRPRRQQEKEELAVSAPPPVPQPITVPGSREVDPLNGVDLYLTYGRFAEARVMLERAIAEEPERLDLRLRMLRVLAELGDSAAFRHQEQQALELGGDAERIDRLKARYPLLLQSERTGTELMDSRG